MAGTICSVWQMDYWLFFGMPIGTDILGYPKVLETLIIVILARLLRFGIDQIFIKIVGYHHFARTVVILNISGFQ
jgi:hypothetical protein